MEITTEVLISNIEIKAVKWLKLKGNYVSCTHTHARMRTIVLQTQLSNITSNKKVWRVFKVFKSAYFITFSYMVHRLYRQHKVTV